MKRAALFLALSTATFAADPAALSLDDCLRLSTEHQPAFASAKAGIAAAAEAVGEARAPYQPQVDFSAGYHRLQKRAFLPSGLSLPGKTITPVVGPLNDWTAGLSSRYLLYDFGERRAGLDTALANRAAAEGESATTKAQVRLSVQSAFFSLAAAQDLQAVASRNLERTRQHMHMAEIRHETGAAPKADVLRLQAEVASARLELINTRSSVRVAAGRLNTAMGRSPEISLAISPPEATAATPLPDFTTDLARALAQRPELDTAARRTVAAKAAVASARAARAPKLHADASYGYNDTVWVPETKEWQAGLSVDVSVFDGGARASRVARARADADRSEAELENRQLQIRQEVWSAHAELERTGAAIAANETNVAASEESLRVTQERYQNGAAVLTDLLDTQTALARAEASLAAARWDYQTARASYDRAIGATP